MRKRIDPNREGGLQPYDRPNQNWRCGNEENGCPCSVGPLASGKCPETTECTPIKEGDRWICNRSGVRGGPCDQENDSSPETTGPTPDGQCCMVLKCRPKRTLRVFRGSWARGAAIFALGAILMLLGSNSRNDLLAPGPLTTHHAQVIQRDQWQQRCSTCHPGANESSQSWIGRALGFHDSRGVDESHATQSALCLNCHETLQANERAPLYAHGLPGYFLAQRQKLTSQHSDHQVQQVSLNENLFDEENNDPLACALCHQEHHGAEHDLLALSDARCQSCHQQQYQSFETNHPEFSEWPLSGSTRIHFSHQNHQSAHFVAANQEFNCRSCHQEDSQGDLTARPTYQQACGSCHEGDLRQSFEQGIALASLPSINETSLTEAGLPTYNWPAQASDDFDGQLSSLMKILLAADPNASEAMAFLGEDFSFFDIDPDDPELVGKAAELMSAIRMLLDEIQEEGHDAIGYRLRKVSGKEQLGADLTEYVASLPIEYIDQLQAAWFNSEGTLTTDTFEEIEERESTGGWKLDSEKLSLTYHPTGHDDRMLKAWIDLIVTLPEKRTALRDACLNEFRSGTTPGACLSCHSIESSPNNQLLVNWSGRNRLAEPKGFTHFSHRPHLTQPELANCSACHQLNTKPQPLSLASSSVAGTQAEGTDFVELQKSSCTQCHQPKGAGDHCSQCHNYHIDPQSLKGITLREQLDLE